MEDKEIVALFWARDEGAIQAAQNKYQRYLSQIAYRILGNLEDCDECVNDAYLAAWNAIPPHRPERLSTFLGKLTRRIAVNRYLALNAEKRRCPEIALSLSELRDCLPQLAGEDSYLDSREISRCISEYLRTQKPQQRQVFLSRYYYGLSVAEISARFHISQSKTKSMLLRLRRGLRAKLEQEELL